MENSGGCEAFDLTGRRGDAEEDAEMKKQEREKDRDPRVGRAPETAENAEERRPSFARMDKAEPYPTG
jgi:hypothetical protein